MHWGAGPLIEATRFKQQQCSKVLSVRFKQGAEGPVFLNAPTAGEAVTAECFSAAQK